MMNEFKVGDKVKSVNRDLYGDILAVRGSIADVEFHWQDGSSGFVSVWLNEIDHAVEDWSAYLVTDEPIVVPPEKKGYEPDGFDREAFDDFRRTL